MDDQRAIIAENVRLVQNNLGPISGVDFGMNRESVAYLEAFIERQRADEDFDQTRAGRMISSLGAFLGECVASATGGRWTHDERRDDWGVALPGGTTAFPLAEVRRQFELGTAGGASITAFYDTAVTPAEH